MPALQEVYCCCNVFPVTYGIYLIALHSMVHGMYAIAFVITSSHLRLCFTTNLLITLSHSLLIPAGIFVLWANLYENWKGARVSAFVLIFVSLTNLATSLMYFILYILFKANSLLDKMLFWSGNSDWVHASDYPFIFWHVQALILVLAVPLWWYYAYILYRYSKLIKSQRVKKIRLRLPKHKTRNKKLRRLTLRNKKIRKPEREDVTETEAKKQWPFRPEIAAREQDAKTRYPEETKEAMRSRKEEEML